MKKEIKPIAYIQNDFTSKFGIPRQSGLSNLLSTIVFEKEFSDDPNAEEETSFYFSFFLKTLGGVGNR